MLLLLLFDLIRQVRGWHLPTQMPEEQEPPQIAIAAAAQPPAIGSADVRRAHGDLDPLRSRQVCLRRPLVQVGLHPDALRAGMRFSSVWASPYHWLTAQLWRFAPARGRSCPADPTKTATELGGSKKRHPRRRQARCTARGQSSSLRRAWIRSRLEQSPPTVELGGSSSRRGRNSPGRPALRKPGRSPLRVGVAHSLHRSCRVASGNSAIA